MKLQKLYAIFLGLAFLAPQANLQAVKIPASQGNFSWVGSTFGTLASFSAKTLTFPFTTLSFCYRNLFAGAVLVGVAYWGYRYVQPLWVKHQEVVSDEAQECYNTINRHSYNFETFNTLAEQAQNTEAQRVQTILNKCSWTEWFHSTTWLPLARGGSAGHFFQTLKQAKGWDHATKTEQKRNWLTQVAKSKCALAAILACKYSGITKETIEQDYKATSGEGSLAIKVLCPATSLTHAAPAKITTA